MREPNDLKLAQKTSLGLIDLILGGHDHYYSCQKVNSTYILRSGTDFKQMSYIEAWKAKGGGWDFSITRRDIVRSTPEDPATVELMKKLTSSLKTKLEKTIGYTAAPLDGRFITVRTRESNLGNFVCDLMRYYYRTDCALMAAGTIRGDQIYSPGILRLKDMMNCFPFEDPVVVLKVTGKALYEALENSVSLVPALEGRYPQVSNIVFEYDPSLPAGSRVRWIKVDGQDLDHEKTYALATRGYMARGKDGYDSLLAESEGGVAEEIVSEENGVLISTILRQYFLSLKVMGKWRRWSPGLGRPWSYAEKDMKAKGTIKEPKVSPGSSPTTRQSKHRRSPKNGRNGSIQDSQIRHQKPIPSRPQKQQATVSTDHVDPLPTNPEVKLDLVDSDSDTDTSDADQVPPPTPLSAHPLVSPMFTQASSSYFTPDLTQDPDFGDRLYSIARFYAKRWMKRAGIKEDQVSMVDEQSEDALPSWTKGIAPKLEGRIMIVGGDDLRSQMTSNG